MRVGTGYDIHRFRADGALRLGGIDIEEVAEQHPEHLSRTHFSNLRPFSDYIAKVAVSSVGVTGNELTALTRIVSALGRAFLQYDLTLAEINPIGKLDDGTFIALNPATSTGFTSYSSAVGDLNGDGTPDVAFLLTQSPGGSGTFYYAVVALRTATGYTGTNAVLLGDRIAPQTANDPRADQVIDLVGGLIDSLARLRTEP